MTLVLLGIDADRSGSGANLRAAVERLEAAGADVKVAAEVQRAGLIRSASTHDLLVVGVDPLEGSTSWASRQILRHSPTPSCFIPTGWQHRRHPVTVGVDTDGSSDIAVYFAAREAARTGQDLRLVHSWPPPDAADPGTGPAPEASQAAWGVLESAAHEARLAMDGSSRELELELLRDKPSAALTSFARDSSMIVIGTHRRGSLMADPLGSVAQSLVGHVDCPVCVVPPPE